MFFRKSKSEEIKTKEIHSYITKIYEINLKKNKNYNEKIFNINSYVRFGVTGSKLINFCEKIKNKIVIIKDLDEKDRLMARLQKEIYALYQELLQKENESRKDGGFPQDFLELVPYQILNSKILDKLRKINEEAEHALKIPVHYVVKEDESKPKQKKCRKYSISM